MSSEAVNHKDILPQHRRSAANETKATENAFKVLQYGGSTIGLLSSLKVADAVYRATTSSEHGPLHHFIEKTGMSPESFALLTKPIMAMAEYEGALVPGLMVLCGYGAYKTGKLLTTGESMKKTSMAINASVLKDAGISGFFSLIGKNNSLSNAVHPHGKNKIKNFTPLFCSVEHNNFVETYKSIIEKRPGSLFGGRFISVKSTGQHYAEARSEYAIKNTSKAISHHYETPFHTYSKGMVNLVHLAALLGSDKSKDAESIKQFACFDDPAFKEIFDNANNVLAALKDGVNNRNDLRAFCRDAYRSLGPVAEYIFSDYTDFKKSLSDWHSICLDAFTSAITKTAEMEYRQHGVETLASTLKEISGGNGLSQKDVMKHIDSLSKINVLTGYGQIGGEKGAFDELHTYTVSLEKILRQAVDTQEAPVHILLDEKFHPLSHTATREGWDVEQMTHNLHHQIFDNRFPSPHEKFPLEAAIDALIAKVTEKVENSNDRKKLGIKTEDLMSDFEKQLAITRSRRS